MNRSRSQLDISHSRNLSLHKPGVIPYASQNISPILSSRHKYELKQKIWPKQTIESWFENHSFDDRRAVYSFLNTLNDRVDNHNQTDDRISSRGRRKSPTPRFPTRENTTVVRSSNSSAQRRASSNHRHESRASSNHGHESRASKRDLGEILESLESFRPLSSVQEKGVQTSTTPTTIPLPDLNGAKNSHKTEKRSRRSTTSLNRYTETVQPQASTDNTSNVNDDDETNKPYRRYLSQTWRVINPREDAEKNIRPENNSSSFFNYTKKVYPEYFFIHPDWY